MLLLALPSPLYLSPPQAGFPPGSKMATSVPGQQIKPYLKAALSMRLLLWAMPSLPLGLDRIGHVLTPEPMSAAEWARTGQGLPWPMRVGSPTQAPRPPPNAADGMEAREAACDLHYESG